MGVRAGGREGREGQGNLTATVTQEEGGEMYGTQPAEHWKTVVQTNDPQPDRYGPHRKDGHKAQFVEINSQEAHEY